MIAAFHGTLGGYTNQRCRCESCRQAATEYHRAWKARVKAVGIPPHMHGTANTYTNYGCRCTDCKDARDRAEGRR